MRRLVVCWMILVNCVGVCVNRSLAAEPVPARWLAHDMQRPRPAVVTPGKLSLPVAPPSDAVILFDGADLTKWRDAEGGPAKWKVVEGNLETVANSGYLFSAGKFGDVQLHIEWATPVPAAGRGQARGNSGLFLMGLYEVQVLDSYQNETYADGQAGAIYGQFPPLVNACLPPGQWQSYDIVFRRPRFHANGTLEKAARLTVIHNGILVQDHVELWGPTTWMQNLPYTAHADKLPISLQDHGNPVRYRNIWLRELAEEPAAIPPLPKRDVVTMTPEQLRKYTGAYKTFLGELGTIELDGDQLRLHMKTKQVIDLLPLSPSEFALRWTAASVTFKEKESGEIAGFTLHLGGEHYPVSRQAGTP
jgi:hypothetical protein